MNSRNRNKKSRYLARRNPIKYVYMQDIPDLENNTISQSAYLSEEPWFPDPSTYSILPLPNDSTGPDFGPFVFFDVLSENTPTTPECDSCSQGFEKISELIRHAPEHGDVYKCKYCDLSLESSKVLKTHVRHYHESLHDDGSNVAKDMFVCAICDKIFTEADAFEDHVQHHLDEELERRSSDQDEPRNSLLRTCELENQSFEDHLDEELERRSSDQDEPRNSLLRTCELENQSNANSSPKSLDANFNNLTLDLNSDEENTTRHGVPRGYILDENSNHSNGSITNDHTYAVENMDVD